MSLPEGHIRNPHPDPEAEVDSTEGVHFSDFVRKPFIVQAIEITEDNIEDLAEFIGTIRKKPNGTPYIQVERTLVPNIFQVYPGFWMTKMGENIRCYSRRAFKEQFIDSSPDIEKWVEFLNREVDNA